MKEFFHGWRRKAGLVTLVIACVFAVVWIRSFAIEDLLLIYRSDSLTTFAALEGHLEWNVLDESYSDWVAWETFDLSHGRDVVAHFEDDGVDYIWEGAGFMIASGNCTHGVRLKKLQVPYWSIVLPLAILSACLLLVPSRNRRVTADPSHA